MEISVDKIKKSFAAIISRYHLIIFVVLVAGSLTIAVFMLNDLIVQSGDSTDYTPTSISTSFDQDTIDRVEQLKSRDEASAELNLGPGRSNPFVE